MRGRAHGDVGDAEGLGQLGHADELAVRDELQHPLAPDRHGQEIGLLVEHASIVSDHNPWVNFVKSTSDYETVTLLTT